MSSANTNTNATPPSNEAMENMRTWMSESNRSGTPSSAADQMKFRVEMSTAIMMPAALRVVELLGITSPSPPPFSLLDAACGPGVVADALYRSVSRDSLDKSKILCGEISEDLVSVTNDRAEKEGWTAVRAELLDGRNTGGKVGDEEMNFVTCNMGMHVIDDPDAALRDIHRVLKPRGLFSFSTMHATSQGWVPILRAALLEISPRLTLPDPLPMQLHGQGRWGDGEWVSSHLPTMGFETLGMEVLKHKTQIDGAETYLTAFSPVVRWIWGMLGEEARGSDEFGFDKLKGLFEDKVREMGERRRKDGKEGWELEWTILIGMGRKV
ncbi:hypothetical protein MKZ38_005105 [Zalerion maritima]|uniref:Methyltransferase domain-containing protein n=1 Tax=Zalerion maritima TaxID=339359 RepID=A0AAD5WPH2_9PEZI|nr:hypothetical protein MKZ38_005105 [Zalerion maritima]